MSDGRWTAMDIFPNAPRFLGLSARICDPAQIDVVLSSVTESVSFLLGIRSNNRICRIFVLFAAVHYFSNLVAASAFQQSRPHLDS